jgi:hypothetical protein
MTLAEQYKNVIADLAQDVGYLGNSQAVALKVLKSRLYELEEVHPTLFADNEDTAE